MVIRKYHTLRWWVTIAVCLLFVSMALPIGIAVWYTGSQISHECQALDFIIHSNIQNKKFLSSVEYWHDADGC